MTNKEIDTEYEMVKNKFAYFFYGAIITAFVLLFFDKCHEPKRGATTIKEQKGSFKANKPANVPITTNVEVATTKKTRGIGSFSKNDNVQYNEQNYSLINELLKENEQLSKDYYLQNDSIRKGMYQKAIQLNAFNKTFDDPKVKINISGIARGTVESIKADYIIKEQQIAEKQRVFALKVGAEYGNTTSLSKSVVKANVEAEFRKVSFSYGYDTEQRHWIGVKKNLFEIKR